MLYDSCVPCTMDFGLLGFLVAIIVTYVIGHGGARTTALCIFITALIVGRAFWVSWPEIGIRSLTQGVLLFLSSTILLLFGLGQLRLSTAQTIANWYARCGTGASVGLLIIQWMMVPLPLGIARWRSRRVHDTG